MKAFCMEKEICQLENDYDVKKKIYIYITN